MSVFACLRAALLVALISFTTYGQEQKSDSQNAGGDNDPHYQILITPE